MSKNIAKDDNGCGLLTPFSNAGLVKVDVGKNWGEGRARGYDLSTPGGTPRETGDSLGPRPTTYDIADSPGMNDKIEGEQNPKVARMYRGKLPHPGKPGQGR